MLTELLRRVNLPYLRMNRLRTSLTVVGIALGVAMLVSVDLVNRSLAASFRSSIDDLAGKAVYQVTAKGDGQLEEGLGQTLEGVSGVAGVTPVVQGMAPMAEDRSTLILLMGVDPERERSFRSYKVSRGNWLIVGDEQVLIGEAMARRLGLDPGDAVKLLSPAGTLSFKVGGVLADEGPAMANGGHLMLLDWRKAQELAGTKGNVTRFDIAAAETLDLQALREQIAARLPEGAQLQRPSERGNQTQALVKSFQQILYAVSAIGMFIGLFLVYNTMAVNVAQRRHQIGVLRALGVRKNEVRSLFLLEVTVVGSVGSVLGTVLGAALGKMLLVLVTKNLAQTYSGIGLSTFVLEPLTLGLGVVSGMVVSLVSAYVPASEAAGISPLTALRRDSAPGGWQKVAGRMAAASVVSFAVYAGLMYAQTHTLRIEVGTVGVNAMLFGIAMLTPYAIVLVTTLIRPILGRVFRTAGVMACDNMAQQPVRTAITVSAVIICVALVIGLSGVIGSVREATGEWINSVFAGDLSVMATQQVVGTNLTGMSGELKQELERIEGVKTVFGRTTKYVEERGQTWALIGVDLKAGRPYLSFHFLQGEGKAALDRLVASDAILVSDNLAQVHKLWVGDTLTLNTPRGTKGFRVAATVLDVSSAEGSVIMDQETYRKYWGDELSTMFGVVLDDASRANEAAREIRAKVGEKYGILIQTNSEARGRWNRQLDALWSSTYALEAVALIVSLLGIINTLVVAVLERTRQIGILRAIGTLRRQVRLMFLLEAFLISMTGTVIGIGAGYGVNATLLFMVKHTSGFVLSLVATWFPVLSLVAVMIVCAFISGYYPARKASELKVTEALQYE